MSVVTLRVSEEEKKVMKKIADFKGLKLSTMIKDIVLNSIEDEFDINIADKAYQEYLDDPKTYSMEEMKERYGL